MKPAGPFVPTLTESMRFSMAGDDCSLHFRLDDLTEKQRADHRSNQVLTGMLQVALLYIAKATDTVCLYDTFRSSVWSSVLERYHAMFERMGLEPLPLERIQYHPMERFYESVAEAASDTDLENLYMISGSNLPIHRSEVALQTSRNLNSKVHFARYAPEYGLPVPETLHCLKARLASAEVTDFLARHDLPLMLKTLGLAGARNVTTVASVAEAAQYLAEYRDDLDVILQQRLDPAQYTEMTVDLFVSDRDVHVTNVRRILFANGLWVGNLLGPAVVLDARHEATLLSVGAYARQHGYGSPAGFNLGIDYFVRSDGAPAMLPELLITEINARWTGGLFPAELVRRLNVAQQDVVAFIDTCPSGRIGDYLGFLNRHLFRGVRSEFAIAPMGFSPYSTTLVGVEQLFVWQIVVGDFEAFKAARERELGHDVLISVPAIRTDQGSRS